MEGLSLGIDVRDSASSQFIGLILNWGLYGLLVAQTCIYAVTFPRDMRINRAIAFVVFCLETVQTITLTYDLYETFVVYYGDVQVLERLGIKWFTTPILGAIVGWIAELFYAWRIYKISHSREATVLVASLAFAQLGAGIAEGLRARSAVTLPVLHRFLRTSPPVASVSWILAMITCDVLIAVIMSYHLLKLRKEFYYDSSFFVRRLLMLTAETGFVTAIGAITTGTLFFGRPNSESFNIPGFIIGKLYANSLLRVLNSRHRTEPSGEIVTFPISTEGHTSQEETHPRDEPPSSSSTRLRRRDETVG